MHLFGNVAPVAEIEALGVPVLEDAAQALGSRTTAGRPGSLGAAATFSFYPSKNLGCFGDGGAIVTNDEAIAEQARVLRFHGSRDKVDYEQVGYNSRLDELQAAILRVQLPSLDEWADGPDASGGALRARGARRASRGCRAPSPVQSRRGISTSSATRNVEQLEAALAAAQIGCKAVLPHARSPPGADARVGSGRRAARVPSRRLATHLAIPMSPVLSRAQAEEVVAAVRGAAT